MQSDNGGGPLRLMAGVPLAESPGGGLVHPGQPAAPPILKEMKGVIALFFFKSLPVFFQEVQDSLLEEVVGSTTFFNGEDFHFLNQVGSYCRIVDLTLGFHGDLLP